MANFQAQVEGITSLTVGTTPTTTELSQFLNDGVIDVTNRWLAIKPLDADNFTREGAEQTSNGFNPGTSKIVSVIRESGTNNQWYPCTKQPIHLQYLVTDTESLHYASKYNPVYMLTQNRNVHVFPAPSTDGNDTFKVLYVNYSPEETDGTALEYSSTGIKWFPDDKVYLVLLYASLRTIHANLGSKSISAPPDSPSAPVFNVITVAEETIGSVEVGSVTVGTSTSVATVALSAPSIHSLSAPTYTKPTITSRVSFEDFFNGSEDLNPFGDSDPGVFSISAVIPNEPSLSSVTYSNPTLTDATSPAVTVTPLAAASTYTGSAPTYSKPTLATRQSFNDFFESGSLNPLDDNDPGVFATLAVPPDEPTLEVVSYSPASNSSVSTTGSITVTAMASSSVYTGSAPTYTPPSVFGVAGEVTDAITDGTFGTSADMRDWSDWFDIAGDLIEIEEDTELAVAHIQKINASLQAYQSAMQNQLNTFNKENIAYQSAIQESLIECQNSNKANIAKAQNDLQSKLQNASQADQLALQNAIKTMEGVVQSNSIKIQDFNAKVGSYDKEIQAEVSTYQAKLSKYDKELQGVLSAWRDTQAMDMQIYTADIQNELNEYQKELALYQSAVQESSLECQNSNKADLQKAQGDLQVAMQNKNQDDQAALQNAIKTMESIIQDNSIKIQNHGSLVAAFDKEVSTQVQEYKTKLERYSSELQAVLAAWNQTQTLDFQIYQGDIQNELNEFNKENANFQASIQEEVQNLQIAAARVSKQADIEITEVTKQADIDMQKAIKDGDYDLQIKITNVANDLQVKINNTAKDLEAQIQEYAQTLGKYSADIQKYQIQIADEGTEYQWLQDQYSRIKAEYDTAFLIGNQQSQKPRRREES